MIQIVLNETITCLGVKLARNASQISDEMHS